MKNCDKDRMTVKAGFFILVSNIDTTPEDLLTRYFGRSDIETVFKTSKEYLDILPLSKWTDTTVRGKDTRGHNKHNHLFPREKR